MQIHQWVNKHIYTLLYLKAIGEKSSMAFMLYARHELILMGASP